MVDRVLLVRPRGFCAGVTRAIAIVERALSLFGPPVYVRRAIVHNRHVVSRLSDIGAIFVRELDAVPPGAVVVLSAHGVPTPVRLQAARRNLRVIDATCPLVAKIHREVQRFNRLGAGVMLIGYAGHDEVVGTMGQGVHVELVERVSDLSRLRIGSTGRVACVTQTTLAPSDVAPIVDRLRRQFPNLMQPGASDICYATRNRQTAIAWAARQVDLVMVVGDEESSNSLRLRETAEACGVPAYRICRAGEIRAAWLDGVHSVAVSSGASTPECDVTEVVDSLRQDRTVVHEETLVDERALFAMPMELAG